MSFYSLRGYLLAKRQDDRRGWNQENRLGFFYRHNYHRSKDVD